MKKFFSVICAVLLLIPMRVSAANTITFTPPIFLREWSGTSGNFTVPYSAYYKLTLSGAQGSSYGGGEGGLGITQTKTLWLREGTEVKYQCSPQAQRTMSGGVMNINAGETSKLWFDDVLQATSSGGQGTYASNIAPTGCNSVKLYQGGNDNVATYPVHWHTGSSLDGSGCYFKEECWYKYFRPQWHFGPVDSHHNDSDYDNGHAGCYTYCKECHASAPLGQAPECHAGMWTTGIFYRYHGVGDPPVAGAETGSNRKFFLGCGYENGQIVGIQPQVIGYSDNTWVADSSAQANAGAGKFSIQLIEQDRLYYANGLVNSLTYRNNITNLVVYQDPRTNEHYALFVKYTQH